MFIEKLNFKIKLILRPWWHLIKPILRPWWHLAQPILKPWWHLAQPILKPWYNLIKPSSQLSQDNLTTYIPIGSSISVQQLLDKKFRSCQPLNIYISEEKITRLNIVTDSIEQNSLLGGTATALLLATKFCNTHSIPLRIITRDSKTNPVDYIKIVKLNGLEPAKDVTYYTDCGRNELGYYPKKLNITDKDIFLATSWWSASSINKTILNKQFFYIIQEGETFFYNHGDEHLLCKQIIEASNINFIVNSEYLWEYFKDNEPNIVKNGILLNPAFSKKLYQPKNFTTKDKYKLFFYSRPNNPRNLFYYGLFILQKAIERGILDPQKWEIHFAGQDIPNFQFNPNLAVYKWGLMSWEKYANFLSSIDLCLSLIYTPHPSYPPYDAVMSGCVVVSNAYLNKHKIKECNNIILSPLEIEDFLKNLDNGITLAKDIETRKKNLLDLKIPNDWNQVLELPVNKMSEKINV